MVKSVRRNPLKCELQSQARGLGIGLEKRGKTKMVAKTIKDLERAVRAKKRVPVTQNKGRCNTIVNPATKRCVMRSGSVGGDVLSTYRKSCGVKPCRTKLRRTTKRCVY